MAARSFIGRATAVVALAGATFGAAASPLEFDRVFNDRGAPRYAHYVASFRLADGEHRVEVWRDGAARVKRRTDDAIETFVGRSGEPSEWAMTVLDLKRKIRTDVDHAHLARIGHVTDWFGLAHSLSHPAGGYELVALRGDAVPHVETVGACRWYGLTQGTRVSKICWSEPQRLPLAITDAGGAVQWRVTVVESRPLAAQMFAIDDRGFVRNDANDDIKGD